MLRCLYILCISVFDYDSTTFLNRFHDKRCFCVFTLDFWILKKVALQTPRVSSTDEYLLKILLSDGTQKIYTNV